MLIEIPIVAINGSEGKCESQRAVIRVDEIELVTEIEQYVYDESIKGKPLGIREGHSEIHMRSGSMIVVGLPYDKMVEYWTDALDSNHGVFLCKLGKDGKVPHLNQ